jgi:hypothetical protein
MPSRFSYLSHALNDVKDRIGTSKDGQGTG